MTLPLIYADDHLLVLDKPSGLLSVPGRGEDKQDCMATRAMAEFPDALVVHRLDMSTSGLLLMARGKAMQSQFNRMFAGRAVHKVYEAWVAGLPRAQVGYVDLPLICDWPQRPRQKVCFEHGKPSLTEYRCVEQRPAQGVSRMQLVPHTGRSHQLRVHMMALGHPILGDDLYADAAAREAVPRLQLHACRLVFVHPVRGHTLELVSRPDFAF